MGLIFTCSDVAKKIRQNPLFNGHCIIEVPINTAVDPRISHHSDLSIAIIQEHIIIEPRCYEPLLAEIKKSDNSIENVHCGETMISSLYPHDIAYNVLVMEKNLFHNAEFTDSKLKSCVSLEITNVKQGYTRCSVLPVGLNAAITSDEGLYKTLIKCGYKVLKISSGSIELNGFPHGFIGGVGGVVEGYMLINGSLNTHPHGEDIKQFVQDQGYEIVELCQGPLEDVGSILYYQR